MFYLQNCFERYRKSKSISVIVKVFMREVFWCVEVGGANVSFVSSLSYDYILYFLCFTIMLQYYQRLPQDIGEDQKRKAML
ncbi:unnamed protein product [Allacma fusca]|uniref:Uncharacterized protein n=1 Tax=Allacma fusca TaxID=39272 RepID=A0A8J2J940_9HEXA|nr:unnamed protein product [Allacma fusca]